MEPKMVSLKLEDHWKTYVLLMFVADITNVCANISFKTKISFLKLDHIFSFNFGGLV